MDIDYNIRFLLDRCGSEREKKIVKSIVYEGKNLSEIGVDVGVTRQRVHASFKNLSCALQKGDKTERANILAQVSAGFPMSLYSDAEPSSETSKTIRFSILFANLAGITPSFIARRGFFIKAVLENEFKDVEAFTRELFKVVSCFSFSRISSSFPSLKCDEAELCRYLTRSIRGCKVVNVGEGGHYFVCARRHDTSRVMKMLASSRTGRLSSKQIFDGYLRYLAGIELQKHIHMTIDEHMVFIEEASLPTGIEKEDDGSLVVADPGMLISNFLSNTEKAVAMSFSSLKAGALQSSDEIREYVLRSGLSAASARKAMDRSCIIYPVKHGFYKLISET